MLKKILLLLIILFNIFQNIEVFADSIPVENIFSDINSDYKYLDELQTLYDKWMILPGSDWKFNPYQLLTREEFVWITMEVSCKKCIKPNVSYLFIEKYQTKPFYDVWLDNKYFYCIAYAEDNNYINWYDLSYTCDDGTYLEWERPFCTNNNIILEEALAIILRVSWILTNVEAQDIRDDIYNWIITENLSDDVSPKNLDGTVYSFYPDFMKALEYEVVEFDQLWNKSVYYLVEVVDSKLRPKKNITKEEFLRIAFVALKANNCLEKNDDSLWLEMNIYDSNCNENTHNCELSNLSNNDIYDFEAIVSNSCTLWINEPEWYIWRFYHEDTGEEDIKYWKYIDNYIFEKEWMRKIFLRVIDNCWNTSEVFNSLNIVLNNDLIVSINADPIYWFVPLKVDLEWIVIWTNWPFSYEWNFWNWEIGFWKNQEIIYKNEWIYEVVLKVTDSDWNIRYAKVFIKVDDINNLENFDWDWILNWEDWDIDWDWILNWEDWDIDWDWILNWEDWNWIFNWEKLDIDSDLDWVSDMYDDCSLVKWKIENNWCPILSETCSNDNDCNTGYICKLNNEIFWTCEINTLNNNLNNSCIVSWLSLISWNIICETCPCNNYLDFVSTLRNCDVIFPAITSPDNSIIYSKWDFYQIK